MTVCLCDGGVYGVQEHPFLVHPDCPIHAATPTATNRREAAVSKNTVTWEDPPADASERSPRDRFGHLAAQLRENPERWAKLGDYRSMSTVRRIREGNAAAFLPPGDFEVVTAEQGDGEIGAWIRFVPRPGAEE